MDVLAGLWFRATWWRQKPAVGAAQVPLVQVPPPPAVEWPQDTQWPVYQPRHSAALRNGQTVPLAVPAPPAMAYDHPHLP